VRILLVANGYPPTAYGGVETYTHSLAQTLHAADHDVRVFCRESDQNRPDREIITDEVAGIPVTRVVNDFKNIRTFRETYVDDGIRTIFLDQLQANRPDIIHYQHWIALSADLPRAAEDLAVPCLATLHDYWALCHRVHLQDWRRKRCPGPRQGGDCYRCVVGSARPRAWLRQFLRWGKRTTIGRFGQRVRRSVFRDAQSVMALTGTRADFDLRYHVFSENLSMMDHILTPSNYVGKIFEANGYDTSSFTVLPLGVDELMVSGQTTGFPNPIRLAYIGSVLPGKGLHVLLEALRHVRSQRFVLEVLGRMDADPVYGRRITKLARRDSRVNLKGPFSVENKGEIYANIDLLIIPSVVPETFSLVAREALLNGTPVIASRVGALPEIILDGVNGYLFTPGDANELAGILNELDRQPERLRELDIPGPVPIISKEEHAEALLRIYQELC
jgi:glycosyltransferase involved in cell wall biosynthesis